MSERSRPKPSPPTGLAPPTEATGPDGEVIDLVAMAQEACERYYAEFPDEEERWGPAGRDWCRHDLQHKLSWAAMAAEGLVDLDHEIAWLGNLLERRGFLIDRFARSLDLAAQVVREHVAEPEPMAVLLDGSAAMVRERGSFVG